MKRKRHLISIILLLSIGFAILFFPGINRGIIKAGVKDISLAENDFFHLHQRKPIPLDSLPLTTIPVIDSLCIITDHSYSLESFFFGLDALLDRKDTVINIVHVGDSHIQAGFLTGRVMRRMQEYFGNAGRGFIAPLKLSKVNEPDDYYITSVVREWTAGRCIQRDKKTPIGVGGIGIQTVSPSVNFDISIGPVNGAGYEFNQAVIYRCEKSMPMLPAGFLKDSVKTNFSNKPIVPGVMADTFVVSCLTDTLQLQSTRRKQGTDELLPASSFTNTYFGFNLTNGGPGILYHNVGVNSSMFVNYTDPGYIRQLALLKPSLLIISMGTNETFGRRFNSQEFTGQVRTFIALVKEYLPETILLLTTPPECYKRVTVNKKRTYVRNENSELAATSIVRFAKEENIACWDLFAVTGGKNSSRLWFDNKLMGRDRIHFTKEGYYDQAELFFRALMKRYNEHLEAHR